MNDWKSLRIISEKPVRVGAVYPTADYNGRTIWIADALHRGDAKRFVVCADEKLTVF
jgi:hypothetical protein